MDNHYRMHKYFHLELWRYGWIWNHQKSGCRKKHDQWSPQFQSHSLILWGRIQQPWYIGLNVKIDYSKWINQEYLPCNNYIFSSRQAEHDQFCTLQLKPTTEVSRTAHFEIRVCNTDGATGIRWRWRPKVLDEWNTCLTLWHFWTENTFKETWHSSNASIFKLRNSLTLSRNSDSKNFNNPSSLGSLLLEFKLSSSQIGKHVLPGQYAYDQFELCFWHVKSIQKSRQY